MIHGFVAVFILFVGFGGISGHDHAHEHARGNGAASGAYSQLQGLNQKEKSDQSG